MNTIEYRYQLMRFGDYYAAWGARDEVITRLAKKLDIISLARMVGHRDLRMLQIYYRESAEDIAKRL